MYPNSNAIKVMFWCDSEWKDTLTPTAAFGFRMMDTMNIQLFSTYNGKMTNMKERYSIKPFENTDEIIKFKNTMKEKKGNISVRIHRNDNGIYKITGKLDKGEGTDKGRLSHDPNKGMLASIMICIERFEPGSEFLLTSHGLHQDKLDRTRDNKFFITLIGINFKFDGLKFSNNNTPPDRYFTIENKMTEKLATILCDMTTEYKTIFSNHGGCALTCIKGIGCNENVERQMPRPDIVFADSDKKEILIIEGKLEKELSKGIKQLSDAHLEGFIAKLKRLYPDYTIIKGLCITISDIGIINKYSTLEFPIKFALDNNGYFIDLR